MGGLNENSRAVALLSRRYFNLLASEELVQIRHNLDAVLETRETYLFRPQQMELIVPPSAELVPAGPRALQTFPKDQAREALGEVLSPSQVKTFIAQPDGGSKTPSCCSSPRTAHWPSGWPSTRRSK